MDSPTSLQNAFGLFFHLDEILADQDKSLVISIQKIYPDGLPKNFKEAAYFLGTFNEKKLYAIEVSREISNENPAFHFLPIRKTLVTLEPTLSHLVCLGKQLLHWHKISLFCGACGTENRLSKTEIAKICNQCERITYPHYHPAVIVLIQRKNEILLARSPHFTEGLYSPLAGFVDPAETAEQAVIREVYEEVALKIKDLRYFASQPWPFPSSFMMGYTAKYDSGDICINVDELEDAQWFNIKKLPAILPSKSSISRQLIESVL